MLFVCNLVDLVLKNLNKKIIGFEGLFLLIPYELNIVDFVVHCTVLAVRLGNVLT